MRSPSVAVSLSLCCFLAFCSRPADSNGIPPQTNKKENRQAPLLSESQAVELAEAFIVRNGYTDLLPDKDNLAYETIEWEGSVDEMLRLRHDTLKRKSFGISPGRKGGSEGWSVVFEYKQPSSVEPLGNGRAVTMNPDGSKMRVEHVDFILAKVGKKL